MLSTNRIVTSSDLDIESRRAKIFKNNKDRKRLGSDQKSGSSLFFAEIKNQSRLSSIFPISIMMKLTKIADPGAVQDSSVALLPKSKIGRRNMMLHIPIVKPKSSLSCAVMAYDDLEATLMIRRFITMVKRTPDKNL